MQRVQTLFSDFSFRSIPKKKRISKKIEVSLAGVLLLLILILTPIILTFFSLSFPMNITAQSKDVITPAIIKESNDFANVFPNMPNQWESHYTRTNGSLLLSTEFLTLKLVGSDNRIHPTIFFWYTPDKQGTKIKFLVTYKSIIEYNDTNHDFVFQHNEIVSDRILPLALGNWSYSVIGPYNDSKTGRTIDVFMWTTGWLTSHQNIPPHPPQQGVDNSTWFESVNVSLALHLYQKNVTETIPGSNMSYHIFGGLEAKIDFNITGWPFISPTHRLAVEIALNGNAKETTHEGNKEKHIFALHSSNGTVEIDPEEVGNETMHSYEHKFIGLMNSSENQIDFISAIKGTPHGTFRWTKVATVTNNTDRSIYPVNVTASYISNGKNLLVYLSYPSFNGTISHDPTTGVVRTKDIPGNNPPNIISVDYPSEISAGETLEIKINATDDFSIESVEVIFTSPTKYIIKKDAILSQDHLYHCVAHTGNWESGIWHFKIVVRDIFDASTTSRDFELNILGYGAASNSPYGFNSLVVVIAGLPIDILWSIIGLSVGGFTILAILYVYNKRKKYS